MKVQELFENKQIITEGAEARIQHAEDLVFWEGAAGARRAVEALKSLEEGRHQDVTIKWDGSPAIIFGRNEEGKFVLTDKSGFGAKGYDGRPTSAAAVNKMFSKRNPNNPESQKVFAGKMSALYDLYQRSFPKHVIGYLKGDLLYFDTPTNENGNYVFTPNIVTYEVDAESEIGQQIGASTSGVVVHRFMTPDGKDTAVDNTILNQMNSGEVLYFPPVTVERAPNVNDSHAREANNLVQKYGAQIDDMLNVERITRLKMKDLPMIFYTYLNKKVDTGLTNLGADFMQWLATSKVSPAKQARIQEYLNTHINGFNGMWQIVAGIMQIKNDIIKQFDSHDSAIKATTAGSKGGEGYVLDHSEGAIKLVDRSGFTAANRAVQRESTALDEGKTWMKDGVEMCSKECCGQPVTECKCGPNCKHCDCYKKNKINEELSSIQKLSGL
jgi:hypothetical protein